jgi:hypothetical protein
VEKNNIVDAEVVEDSTASGKATYSITSQEPLEKNSGTDDEA